MAGLGMAFGVSRLVHGIRPPEYLGTVGQKKVASDQHSFALDLALWVYNLALCQLKVHAPIRDEPAVQCGLSPDVKGITSQPHTYRTHMIPAASRSPTWTSGAFALVFLPCLLWKPMPDFV